MADTSYSELVKGRRRRVIVALLVAVVAVTAASCSAITMPAGMAAPSRCNGTPDAAAGGLCDAGAGGGGGGAGGM